MLENPKDPSPNLCPNPKIIPRVQSEKPSRIKDTKAPLSGQETPFWANKTNTLRK
jgi:hypothetical protein